MKKIKLLSKIGTLPSFSFKKKPSLGDTLKDASSPSLITRIKNLTNKTPKANTEKKASPVHSKAGIGRPRSAVFLYHDGFTLSGLVCARSFKGVLNISDICHSDNSSVSEAVAEVASSLLSLEGMEKLPSKTYLVSSLAMTSLVHLPVSPRKQRAKAQMSEMVRWEIEDAYMAHTELFSLESILMGRDLISGSQRIEIAEENGRSVGSDYYSELLGQQVVMDCLAVQELIVSDDDEQVCAWQGQLQTEPGDEGFDYIGAAISNSTREIWVKACSKSNLNLQAIIPAQGVGLSHLVKTEKSVLLIEVSQEQISSFRIVEDGLERMSTRVLVNGSLSADEVINAIRDLVNEDITTIYIHVFWQRIAEFVEEIKEKCEDEDRQVIIFGDPDGENKDFSLLCLEAAIHAFFNISPKHLNVTLQACPPQPPVWKNKALWPWIAMAGVVIGIVSSHIYLTEAKKGNEWALELLDIEYAKKKKIKSEINSTARQTERLTEELEKIRTQIVEEKRLTSVLDLVIKKRQDMVPGVFESIGRAMNNQVVLVSVEENSDRQGFTIKGWSVKDSSAQFFGTSLNKELVDWRYKVSDIKVQRSMQKRRGLTGYSLSIWLKKMNEKEYGEMKVELEKKGRT